MSVSSQISPHQQYMMSKLPRDVALEEEFNCMRLPINADVVINLGKRLQRINHSHIEAPRSLRWPNTMSGHVHEIVRYLLKDMCYHAHNQGGFLWIYEDPENAPFTMDYSEQQIREMFTALLLPGVKYEFNLTVEYKRLPKTEIKIIIQIFEKPKTT